MLFVGQECTRRAEEQASILSQTGGVIVYEQYNGANSQYIPYIQVGKHKHIFGNLFLRIFIEPHISVKKNLFSNVTVLKIFIFRQYNEKLLFSGEKK